MNKFWKVFYFILVCVPLALFGTCALSGGIGGIAEVIFSKNILSTNILMTIVSLGFCALLIGVGYFIFKRIINFIRKGQK